MVFTQTQVKMRIAKKTDLIKRVPLADVSYVLPSREWLFKEFRRNWLGFIDENGLKYSDAFDCNKFAYHYFVRAQWSHYLAFKEGLSEAQSMALGVMYYHDEGMEIGHAINWAVEEENQEMIFIEPQNGREVRLEKSEEDGIYVIVG